ncbi:MAG: hypothetical protein DRI98_11855 [Bacteroidetes bacterium]|nr:MAG: hypothetical protein DRI98_11855 [Bacteroidota bacterium]
MEEKTDQEKIIQGLDRAEIMSNDLLVILRFLNKKLKTLDVKKAQDFILFNFISEIFKEIE